MLGKALGKLVTEIIKTPVEMAEEVVKGTKETSKKIDKLLDGKS